MKCLKFLGRFFTEGKLHDNTVKGVSFDSILHKYFLQIIDFFFFTYCDARNQYFQFMQTTYLKQTRKKGKH